MEAAALVVSKNRKRKNENTLRIAKSSITLNKVKETRKCNISQLQLSTIHSLAKCRQLVSETGQ